MRHIIISDKAYAGQKGDYVNADTVTVDVEAGKVAQKDIICNRKIK